MHRGAPTIVTTFCAFVCEGLCFKKNKMYDWKEERGKKKKKKETLQPHRCLMCSILDGLVICLWLFFMLHLPLFGCSEKNPLPAAFIGRAAVTRAAARGRLGADTERPTSCTRMPRLRNARGRIRRGRDPPPPSRKKRSLFGSFKTCWCRGSNGDELFGSCESDSILP